MALTKKQKLFVEEYLIDLNATQAAIRAGYSPQTAQQTGSENLSKPVIKGAIDRALAERSKRTGINADRVLTEIAKLAFINPADIIDFTDGSVKQDACKEDLACIQSIKIKTSYSDTGESVEKEVKIYDKKSSLELLGKHLGIFNDKLKIEGVIPVVIIDDMEVEDDD